MKMPFRHQQPSRTERLVSRWPYAAAGVAAVAVMAVVGRIAIAKRRRAHYAMDTNRFAEHADQRREKASEFDDATIAHRVETVLFRDADVPKGRINVNAENGRVYLRGTLDDAEQIARLERAARDVRGVRGVVNLLHTPGTPAPSANGGSATVEA
jgi:osmotically-inducible protein OsmY